MHKTDITYSKRFSLIAILAFLFTLSSAQIAEEILSYQDSSRMIVNNGRELLIDKIALYDFEKANEIYLYLQEITSQKQQRAFSNSETIYINLITGNYRELLNFCKTYQTKYYLKVFSPERTISQDLYQHFMEQLVDIKHDLEQTQLNDEELEIIKLIIYVIENENVGSEYTTLLNMFKEDYPNSEYTFFINNFLPSEPIKASFAWEAGPTLITPTGELGKAFAPRLMFGMAFDFNIKKLYTSFYINAVRFCC